MATNRYMDANEQNNDKTTASAQFGADVKALLNTTQKTAADNDGSVIRIARAVPIELLIRSLSLMCSAITGLTAVRCGIALPDGGDVLDDDLFAASFNASAGSATGFDLLASVDLANRTKTIGELYQTVNGAPLAVRSVDIVLSLITAGTNTGTLTTSGQAHVQ